MPDELSANRELYCSQYMQAAVELVFIHWLQEKSLSIYRNCFRTFKVCKVVNVYIILKLNLSSFE